MECEVNEIKEALYQGRCDIAIVREVPEDDENFSRIVCMNDPLVALLPKNHPLAKQPAITMNQLAHEKFVLKPPGTVTYDLTLKLCRQSGFEPDITFTSKSNETLTDRLETELEYRAIRRRRREILQHQKWRL
ncbi:MAG: hypothetical protein EOM54_12095 [Clostridia bacterium]|nr:hypothetical protein [Clostridia bacterium]